MILTNNDKQYKSLCNRIGAALIAFYVIFNVVSVGITTLQGIVLSIYPSDLLDVIFSLAYYASYLFAFMFPVLFFKLISKKHKAPDLHLNFKLSRKLWIIIPAALGINFLAAEINHILLLPINFSQLISSPQPESYHLYNFILDIIGTAIVPAFCEEFLFRGLILFALLPYGKKTAVLGSAILFGLMHQNPAQIVYTVVLGVVLALIAIESNSIWGGIILHFANNFVSVIMSAVIYTFPPEIANVIYLIIFFGIMLIGVIFGTIMLVRDIHKRKKLKMAQNARVETMSKRISQGLFGVSDIPFDEEPEYKLSDGYAVRGFFAPCNLIFMIFAAVNIALLLTLALLMNMGGLYAAV